MKRTVLTQEREIVDSQTGEILRVECRKTFKEKVDSEKFYMVFVDYVSPIYKLKGEAPRKLLDWLCVNAAFNTGKVELTTKKRIEIQESLGLHKNTIINALKKLIEAGLVTEDKGEIQINPEIFWKGYQKARKDEAFKNKELHITYELVDIKES